MQEITPTQMQLEDSFASVLAIADDPNEQFYVPEQVQVPRPDFTTFKTEVKTTANLHNLPEIPTYGSEQASNNRMVFQGEHSRLLGHQGLRGYAAGMVEGKKMVAPAIILEGAGHVALLTADLLPDLKATQAQKVSEMQHSLLEVEYLKHRALVGSHTPGDVANAGATAPALMAASAMPGENLHTDMHDLAGTTNGTNAFGKRFSEAGRQNFVIKGRERSVQSAILPLGRVAFLAGSQDQLPEVVGLLGLPDYIDSNTLATGLTFSANTSRVAAANTSVSEPSRQQIARLKTNMRNVLG